MCLHQIGLERQCLFGIDPFLISSRVAAISQKRLSKRESRVGKRKARVLGDGLPVKFDRLPRSPR